MPCDDFKLINDNYTHDAGYQAKTRDETGSGPCESTGFGGRRDNGMEDSKQRTFRIQDAQSRFLCQFLWFLIPSATSLLDHLMDTAILISSEQAPTAAAMFDQQDPSLGFADSLHFLKRCHRIVKRAG